MEVGINLKPNPGLQDITINMCDLLSPRESTLYANTLFYIWCHYLSLPDTDIKQLSMFVRGFEGVRNVKGNIFGNRCSQLRVKNLYSVQVDSVDNLASFPNLMDYPGIYYLDGNV